MLPAKFRVNWHLSKGEEAKNRCSRWPPWLPSWIYHQHEFSYEFDGHLGFPIGTILAIFDLTVTPMLPSKFGVNWPFGSGEEAKIRFSRWRPWGPSWISDRNYFSYFCFTSHPDAFCQVCLFVLRFYGPVNPMGSCRARSVYLTTRLLGRLSTLSG